MHGFFVPFLLTYQLIVILMQQPDGMTVNNYVSDYPPFYASLGDKGCVIINCRSIYGRVSKVREVRGVKE